MIKEQGNDKYAMIFYSTFVAKTQNAVFCKHKYQNLK